MEYNLIKKFVEIASLYEEKTALINNKVQNMFTLNEYTWGLYAKCVFNFAIVFYSYFPFI